MTEPPALAIGRPLDQQADDDRAHKIDRMSLAALDEPSRSALLGQGGDR